LAQDRLLTSIETSIELVAVGSAFRDPLQRVRPSSAGFGV